MCELVYTWTIPSLDGSNATTNDATLLNMHPMWGTIQIHWYEIGLITLFSKMNRRKSYEQGDTTWNDRDTSTTLMQSGLKKSQMLSKVMKLT